MKVVLLGTSGFAGSAILKEALDVGIKSPPSCGIEDN